MRGLSWLTCAQCWPPLVRGQMQRTRWSPACRGCWPSYGARRGREQKAPPQQVSGYAEQHVSWQPALMTGPQGTGTALAVSAGLMLGCDPAKTTLSDKRAFPACRSDNPAVCSLVSAASCTAGRPAPPGSLRRPAAGPPKPLEPRRPTGSAGRGGGCPTGAGAPAAALCP